MIVSVSRSFLELGKTRMRRKDHRWVRHVAKRVRNNSGASECQWKGDGFGPACTSGSDFYGANICPAKPNYPSFRKAP